jgi:NifU-like protein involved in Fe-S cluster formation
MQYSEQMLDCFYDLQHALVEPCDLTDYVSASAGMLENGDAIEVFVKLNQGCLSDIRYRVRASVVTMACCEFLSKRCVGLTATECKAVSAESVLDALNLAKTQIPSVLLPLNAIKQCVNTYP